MATCSSPLGRFRLRPGTNIKLGVYNGVVLHEWTRLPNGIGANSANTRRAVFCGAQSVSLAWGQGYSEAPKYIEDLIARSVVGEPANENCVNSGKLLAA